VLLQPLLPAHDFQPFSAVVDAINANAAADLAIVVESESDTIVTGASLLLTNGAQQFFAMSAAVAGAIEKSIGNNTTIGTRHVDTPEGACSVLHTTIAPPPALLVLGAGLDAEPVVRIAAELGWRCTVYDHRPAYMESRSLPRSTRTLCHPVDELSQHVQLDTFDMAVVMSHHLASDRSYLGQLAATEMAYIGLLGPTGRRKRLMGDLGDAADALRGRLRGPAGIDLGGRGPGPIALSIVSEMQQHLSQRGEV
jgi:xanthine/CO dehydrogenase XdhC/CoxF family maturation factor